VFANGGRKDISQQIRFLGKITKKLIFPAFNMQRDNQLKV
jgi:hypothetical protein